MGDAAVGTDYGLGPGGVSVPCKASRRDVATAALRPQPAVGLDVVIVRPGHGSDRDGARVAAQFGYYRLICSVCDVRRCSFCRLCTRTMLRLDTDTIPSAPNCLRMRDRVSARIASRLAMTPLLTLST